MCEAYWKMRLHLLYNATMYYSAYYALTSACLHSYTDLLKYSFFCSIIFVKLCTSKLHCDINYVWMVLLVAIARIMLCYNVLCNMQWLHISLYASTHGLMKYNIFCSIIFAKFCTSKLHCDINYMWIVLLVATAYIMLC